MDKTWLLLLILIAPQLQAASLFGLDLRQATREQMRVAVKNTGAQLITQSVGDGLYDIYASAKLIPDSHRLYLGFVKKDDHVAFVEYEFIGLNQPQLLQRLSSKYGKPSLTPAQFHSDKSYQWLSEGVQIVLYQDWSAYRTRLLYFIPENLALIRQEYRQLNTIQASLPEEEVAGVY